MVKKFKKNILKVIFGVQITFFTLDFCFGSRGFWYIKQNQMQIENLRQEILLQEKTINDLNSEIKLWQTDSFVKEKYARENLQMAKSGETVYMLFDK